MACTLVEVLKRQGIAKVKTIHTGMDVQPVVNRGDYSWSSPITQITFVLTRDKYADCVQDYHQRKVIEIFENCDKSNTACDGQQQQPGPGYKNPELSTHRDTSHGEFPDASNQLNDESHNCSGVAKSSGKDNSNGNDTKLAAPNAY